MKLLTLADFIDNLNEEKLYKVYPEKELDKKYPYNIGLLQLDNMQRIILYRKLDKYI